MAFWDDVAATVKDTVSKAQIVGPNNEPISNPKVDSPSTQPRGLNPAAAGGLTLDGELSEPAYQGTRYAQPDSSVDFRTFDDFISKRNQFERMLFDWSLEDDVEKRKEIINDYNSKNDFANNEIYNYYMTNLIGYDDNTSREGEPTGLFPPILRRTGITSRLQKELDETEQKQRGYITKSI